MTRKRRTHSTAQTEADGQLRRWRSGELGAASVRGGDMDVLAKWGPNWLTQFHNSTPTGDFYVQLCLFGCLWLWFFQLPTTNFNAHHYWPTWVSTAFHFFVYIFTYEFVILVSCVGYIVAAPTHFRIALGTQKKLWHSVSKKKK